MKNAMVSILFIFHNIKSANTEKVFALFYFASFVFLNMPKNKKAIATKKVIHSVIGTAYQMASAPNIIGRTETNTELSSKLRSICMVIAATGRNVDWKYPLKNMLKFINRKAKK